MNIRCCTFVAAFSVVLVCSTAEINKSHFLAKRQALPRDSRNFPLSRSRQFPPPEELDEAELEDSRSAEDSEYDTISSEEPLTVRRFRGRQQPPEDEDYHYTEVPLTTTPSPPPPTTTKTPNKISTFNNRLSVSRSRFGSSQRVTTTSTTTAPKVTTSSSRFRGRLTSVPAQRIDAAAAQILNNPPPPRSSSRSSGAAITDSGKEPARKPLLDENNSPATRRIGTGRVRTRGRPRSRSSTTTTTTTTTTPSPDEEYYYYYYDEEEKDQKQPLATTTSTTTTTTTTKRPISLPRRPALGRGRPGSLSSRSSTTVKPRGAAKFDPESQFVPPPEDAILPVEDTTRSTKRFTTSTTEAPGPGGIPAHLKGKYKPRTDGRFVDYLRDPNRPRELKGFDLTDYPFYIRVPEDIVFECDDKKDGYYASIPHHCQLFHYCFAGSRYDFLCANYTLYDQTTFTCRFANNVDCPSSDKFYYRNDDLWKEVTTVLPEEQPKRKKITPKDEDYDEEEYDDEEYSDEDEDEEHSNRRRRPYRRRRNRHRKNKRKPTTTTP